MTYELKKQRVDLQKFYMKILADMFLFYFM